ncbi:MAG: homoserine dehydrogenase [Verrucomicrobiota bacterium]
MGKLIRIGLAGLGNVGAGVYKNLEKNREILIDRTGFELKIARIALRDPDRPRPIAYDRGLVTTDWRELLNDPELAIIVELIGGTSEAKELVEAAIRAGKTVVTGNKALLAEHGQEIIALSEKHKVPLYFEAAVAGGIPIIKAVREALVGNRITSIFGILNGTCNYILSRMTDAGLSYEAALDEAQEKGYAEADPTLDINGMDAAHKAIILAWLSYGVWVKPEEILVEGVDSIRASDIFYAAQLGYIIKLLGVIRKDERDCIEVRVQPTLIPEEHILASVNGVFNALAVTGDVVGETLFYGGGAGMDATSSSVISDLADAAGHLPSGHGNEGFVPQGVYGSAMPSEEITCEFYLRLAVQDRPGVIAQITRVLADHRIGIRSLVQPVAEPEEGQDAELMLMLHRAKHGQMKQAAQEIAALDCTLAQPVLMPVESLGQKA